MSHLVFKKYQIIRKLHQGEKWEVFLAKDDRNHLITIKLAKDYSFKEEGKILKALKHPGIIGFIEEGYDQKTKQYFLIRNYQEGPLLSEVSLNDEEILGILADLAKTLFYLHQQNYLYLDLKPENIIYQNNHTILIDTSLIQSIDKNTKNHQGGSLSYLAPECFLGDDYLKLADFYSLGIILYQILSGKLPFIKNSTHDLILAHLFETPPHPCFDANDLRKKLGDLSLRLLQKNPFDRIEDGNDLILLINQNFNKNYPLESIINQLNEKDQQSVIEKDPKIFYQKSISYLENLDQKTKADYIKLAELYFKNNDFNKLITIFKKLDSAQSLTYQARIDIQQGKFEQANKSLKLLEDKFTQLNPNYQASFHNIKGRIEYSIGNFEQANYHFLLAWDIHQDQNNLEGKMNTDLNLGNVSVAIKDFKKANKYFQRSLEEAKDLKNSLLEAKSYSSLGYLAQNQNHYIDAYHYYKKAYEIFDILGQTNDKIQPGLNLASLYLYFGSPLKADKIINQILKTTQKIHHSYYQAISLLHLSELEIETNQYSLAKEKILQGIELIENNGSKLDRFHFDLSLAEIYLLEKNSSQTKKYLDLAKRDLSQTSLALFQNRFSIIECLHDQQTKNEINYPKIDQLLNQLLDQHDDNFAIKIILNLPSILNHSLSLDHYWNQFIKNIIFSAKKNIPEEFINQFIKKFDSFKESSHPTVEKMNSIKITDDKSIIEKFLYLNTELTIELDFNKLLEKIMDVLIEVTGFERGLILLADDKVLEPVFSKNYHHNLQNDLEQKISESLANTVFTRNKAIITIDALNDERFSHTESIHQLKLKSIICLPFSFRGEILGVIYLDSRLKKQIFNKEELNLLDPFCHQIAIAITNARKFAKKNQEIENLTQELKKQKEASNLKYSYENIIGSHPKMIRMFKLLDKITDTEIPVMIYGESGAGKEMVAKLIHHHGKRKNKPYISINCSAIPDTLFEAELFGSQKGSFTGAHSDKPGLFELANDGTLFLDELGEMPLAMQTKLLRVIQEGEVRRIGGKNNIKVDVRIISATNKDLKAMIKDKSFREDLYYRLVVAPIDIPPLRERKDDIPLLVEHFLKSFSLKQKKKIKQISPQALKKLKTYHWPGNVRELENFIYQLCVFSENQLITYDDLSLKDELGQSNKNINHDLSELIDQKSLSLSEAKQEFEKREIERILERYDGHITKASSHLKIQRPQLSKLIKKYRLK